MRIYVFNVCVRNIWFYRLLPVYGEYMYQKGVPLKRVANKSYLLTTINWRSLFFWISLLNSLTIKKCKSFFVVLPLICLYVCMYVCIYVRENGWELKSSLFLMINHCEQTVYIYRSIVLKDDFIYLHVHSSVRTVVCLYIYMLPYSGLSVYLSVRTENCL